MITSFPIITIDSLKEKFKAYLQAQNPKINAFAPDTIWALLAGAYAQILLDQYGNLLILDNSIYVQNAVGDQVDLWLYRQGLPARGGQTYATISAVVTSSTPVTIPINTVFSDINTGNAYQTLEEVTIPDGTTEFTLYAVNPGSNYLEPIDAVLTDGTVNIEVKSSVNGQEEESDQSCKNRVLTSLRAPISGARQTDYQVYALDYNTTLSAPVVTDSVVIPGFLLINNVDILGLFAVGGTAITNYQLDQGLLPATTFEPFNRSLSPSNVTGLNLYIQSLRLVGLNIHVGTINTEVVETNASPMEVTVSLITGYNLDTKITIESQDVNNDPTPISLTVRDLIKRELRRAICGQAFGGTVINGNNYITIDSLLYVVNLQLSSVNGALARLLTNIQIAGGDISVPDSAAHLQNLYYIYDIESYSAIDITLI